MSKKFVQQLHPVMPEARQMTCLNMSLWEIIHGNENQSLMDEMAGRTPNEFEWIGPFVLPPFQRPPVWSKKKNISFLESVWLGYDIGRYCVVGWESRTKNRFADSLIDGQQRIRAILGYVANKFPVFGYYHGELCKQERTRFGMITFPRAVIREKVTETELRDLYNRLNYGGVAHTRAQRA